MISCKEAAILGYKKEEKPLGWKEAWQLRMHLMMCKFCTAFQKQSNWIGKVFGNLSANDQLSDEEKSQMQSQIASRLDSNNLG